MARKLVDSLIKFIKVPSFTTDGKLTQLQFPEIPFDIKRVYFIQGVSKGAVRGAHTHKGTVQALFCIQGSIKVVLDDGERKEEALLDKPNVGILLEPGVWHEMKGFRRKTILLVLASEKYRSKDYVRSYKDFLKLYAKKS